MTNLHPNHIPSDENARNVPVSCVFCIAKYISMTEMYYTPV